MDFDCETWLRSRFFPEEKEAKRGISDKKDHEVVGWWQHKDLLVLEELLIFGTYEALRNTCLYLLLSVHLGHRNKMPYTGWLKQETFICHGSGGWEVQIKVPADWVLGENSLPALHTAASPCVCTWGGGMRGRQLCLYFSSYQDTKASWGPHTHDLI